MGVLALVDERLVEAVVGDGHMGVVEVEVGAFAVGQREVRARYATVQYASVALERVVIDVEYLNAVLCGEHHGLGLQNNVKPHTIAIGAQEPSIREKQVIFYGYILAFRWLRDIISSIQMVVEYLYAVLRGEHHGLGLRATSNRIPIFYGTSSLRRDTISSIQMVMEYLHAALSGGHVCNRYFRLSGAVFKGRRFARRKLFVASCSLRSRKQQ